MPTDTATTDRRLRYWNRHAAGYDRQMGFFDRRLFRDSRAWVCGQATGRVLEVGVGTGLNLPHYPDGVELIGMDLSPGMLQIAGRRAADLGIGVELREGNAERLGLPDVSFDTVVATFSLCAIPDHHTALAEMTRVLKPGGLLLLADHIVATMAPVRAIQRILEILSLPFGGGENFRRRPADLVPALGYTVERHERFGPAGIVERLAARRTPATPPA